MQKNTLQFLKNFACGGLKALLRSAYLLQSEFQRIIGTLLYLKRSQNYFSTDLII